MATYTPASRNVPSAQRVVEITLAEAGDRIDLVDALGRPARKVQFYLTAATDIIEYTLNSLRKIQPPRSSGFTSVERHSGVYDTSPIEVWSGGGTSFSSTGSTIIEIGDGIQVSSLQIDALTLGTGTTITIVVW